MMTEGVIVIGGGGHAKVVVSTLLDAKIEVLGIYDDNPTKCGTEICGVRIVGPITGLDSSVETNAIMAIGDNKTRRAVAERFQRLHWLTVIHPKAVVHSSVMIGKGSAIFAGAIIQPDVVIGDHCVINSNATVDHDCRICDYVHVGPGSCLAGEVTVGEGTFLGTGVVAIVGRSIGEWSIVGAGGVVIRDVPANVTAVGIPARVMIDSPKT
jgi:sugar O-acyltransferase (sialic acid O-acetyltransferase NeuD family)